MKRDWESLAVRIGRGGIALADRFVNLAVLGLFALLLVYGTYSVWDTQRIILAAQTEAYETYKPVQADDPSLKALQEQNPDVLGWLNVYGTHIDYPLVRGADNNEYINTDAYGNYKMSGAVFLDYRDHKDFTDFNSIVFGHHMANATMFGDLDEFRAAGYFDRHRYGNLYYDGKAHGIKFFAFLKADAFDETIYRTPVAGMAERNEYLRNLRQKAEFYRNLRVTANDRLILLSTCTSDATNGRYVLAGMITDEKIAVPAALRDKVSRGNRSFIVQAAHFLRDLHYSTGLALVLFILLFALLYIWYRILVVRRKKREKENGT